MSYFGNAVYPSSLTDPNSIVPVTASTALSAVSYGKTYVIGEPGNFTITLMPLLIVSKARNFTIVNDSSNGMATINANGSDPIRVNGVSVSNFMLGPGDIATLENNGSAWNLVGKHTVGMRYMPASRIPTQDIGPIFVTDQAGVWTWVTTSYFNGYRSINCGAVEQGTTLTARPGRIDGIGGVVNKADYPGLWAYAQENSLVVTSANWIAGAIQYADLTSTQMRLPDLRNMFLRFSGTDADTANAAPIGYYQADALQNITGAIPAYDGGAIPAGISQGAFLSVGGGGSVVTGASGVRSYQAFDASRVARTSTETRGKSTRIGPLILI